MWRADPPYCSPVGFVVAVVLLLAGWVAIGPWSFAVLLVALLVPVTRRRMRPNRWLLGGLVALVAVGTLVVVLLPDGRLPIPPGGGLLVTSSYDGHAVEPQPIALDVPQHPALAANGSSTMHNDGWATDSYQGPGPLGKDPEVTTSWFGLEECATLAFDPDGRLVALCGDRTGPSMHLLDPETMRPLESLDLPDREKSDKRPWEDLCGGAYFYLDAQARAVVATTDRRVLTVDSDKLEVLDEVDLSDVVPDDDCLVALLPDWAGNTWYVTQDGRVGVAGGTGDPTPLDLAGEIANSIAADDTGVYLVTTEALVKVALDTSGQPEVVWRAAYDHGSRQKPGQLSAGSGTTPPCCPAGWSRSPTTPTHRCTCSSTTPTTAAGLPGPGVRQGRERERQLPGRGRRRGVVVENNYGYKAPGRRWPVGRPGRPRPGRRRPAPECTVGWRSDEIAPTSVAKVSLATGLVYAYTTRPSCWGVSAWYLTAIDARTGETAFSVRTGPGLLFNNHYAAVTLGPDGSAYVATLAGMVRVRDRG